jgi:Xaa-Pro aminopeptidase
MTSIEVHKTAADIVKNAVVKMDAIMNSYKFTDDKIKAAAVAFVENYRKFRPNGSLGHNVGMEVHDVRSPTPTLEPGYIFTIEPAMQIKDEHVGIRLEDMLLITETGYENLSGFVPVEIGDIEKLMAKHRGLSDAMGGH